MLKYSFLETGHIFLILDGEKITIKASDQRCSVLKELLKANPENPDEKEIWKIVDPLREVSTKHLNKTDGSAYIKDVKLSVKIENFFKVNYQNPLQNKRIYNALLTEVNLGQNDLQKFLESEQSSATINKLVIADENGLIVFIDRYLSIYNKSNFFNINSLPDSLKNIFLQNFSGDLPSLLKEFGFDPKFIPKFLTFLKEKKGDNEKFPWISLYLYKTLSGQLAQQNLHKFILEKNFDFFFTMSNHWEAYYSNEHHIVNLKKFLKEVLKWSDIAIINELNNNPMFFSHLNNIVNAYNEMSQYPEFLDQFNLEKWKKLGGLSELQKSIYHFKQKYKPNRKLNQSEKWPSVKHPKKWKIGKFNIIVAQTAHDLIHWSEQMSNCIHGYDKHAISGRSLLLAVANQEGKILITCEFLQDNTGRKYLSQYSTYGNSTYYSEELEQVRQHLIYQILVQPVIKELKLLKEYSVGDEIKQVDDFYRMKKFEEYLKNNNFIELDVVKKMKIKNIFSEKKEQKEFAFIKKK